MKIVKRFFLGTLTLCIALIFTVKDSEGQCTYSYNVQNSGGVTGVLYSVRAVNDMVGWMGGATASIRRTINGGQNWTNANPNPGVVTGDIYCIDAIDSSTALCTTTPNPPGTVTFIYRTTDGGATWVQVFQQAGGFIDGIVMTGALTGFALGDPVATIWQILQTANGGVTWTPLTTAPAQAGSEAGWNNCFQVSGTTMWFGTNNTRVYYTTNAGLTWGFGATTGTLNSYAVQFNSATLGLAAGTAVVKSVNGGTSYNPATVPGTGSITGITGRGSDFWVVRGNFVYRSSDNGTTWNQVYTNAVNMPIDIDVTTAGSCGTGWIVGASGLVVKFSVLTGIEPLSGEVPSSYSLSQNYPNPFNPGTVIRYQLPVNGFVTLKVFDILGKEIATLLNESMKAGTYEANWDASNYPSGLYFYTLTANDFTETKKMILVK